MEPVTSINDHKRLNKYISVPINSDFCQYFKFPSHLMFYNHDIASRRPEPSWQGEVVSVPHTMKYWFLLYWEIFPLRVSGEG